jgi:hypothetical protein
MLIRLPVDLEPPAYTEAPAAHKAAEGGFRFQGSGFSKEVLASESET